MFELLILAVLLGLIPAVIAKNKGYSFGLWWLFGGALFIVALPLALLLKPNQSAIEKKRMEEGYKKCPFCAEMVKLDARVCRYGGISWVPSRSPGFLKADLDPSRSNWAMAPMMAHMA